MVVQGSFFSLYRDSQNSEGGVLFKYEKYYLKSTNDTEEKHFPIYLQILKHSVKFIFQGYIGKNYYHSELFSLPLSPNLNVSDNLTSVLKSIWYGKLNIKQIIDKKDNKEDANTYPLFKKNVSYKNAFFYSNIFEEEKQEKETEYITFSKLLLDFLFDLEHSEIFKFSKFYENMEMRLKENNYFNLIASKYLFEFYKKIFAKKKGKERLHKILIRNYLQAAEQWHILIINNKLEYLFDTEWLQNAEKEYKNLELVKVLKIKEKSIQYLETSTRGNYKKNFDNIIMQSLLWNLKRYNFINCFKLISHNNTNLRIGIFIFQIILTVLFVLSYLKSEPHKIYWAIGISSILLFGGSYIIFNFNKSVSLMLNILFPRLLIAILSGWLLFMATEELWKAWFDISFYYALLPAVGILILILLFIFYEIGNIAVNKINLYSLFTRALYLVLIATFYSVVIGIAGSTIMSKKIIINSGYLSEYLGEIKYNTNLSNLPDSPWTNNSDIFIKTLYFTDYINNKNKIWSDSSQIFFLKNGKKDSIDITSNLSVEMGLITGEIFLIKDMIYKDRRTNKVVPKTVIEKLKKSNTKLTKYINRPLNQNLFGLMKYINAPKSKMKIFYENKPVLLKHKWTRFKIFPGMLLINTFIAMFFGIFFQLSVQEKTITEPI